MTDGVLIGVQYKLLIYHHQRLVFIPHINLSKMQYTPSSRIIVDDEVFIPAPPEYDDDCDSDLVSVATSATLISAKLRIARLRAEFVTEGKA